MQLEQPGRSAETDWSGTVPSAFDGRVLAVVVVLAGLAASVNVPYGGLSFAVVAFLLLASTGTAAHVVGARRLRRITDGLVDRLNAAGAPVEGVTRSTAGTRTAWTVHTREGDLTVGGLAMAPVSTLTVEWAGIADSMGAREAETNLDDLADGLFEDLFDSDRLEGRR